MDFREQAIEDLMEAVPHTRFALEKYLKDKEDRGLNSVFAYALEQRIKVLQLEELFKCKRLSVLDISRRSCPL